MFRDNRLFDMIRFVIKRVSNIAGNILNVKRSGSGTGGDKSAYGKSKSGNEIKTRKGKKNRKASKNVFSFPDRKMSEDSEKIVFGKLQNSVRKKSKKRSKKVRKNSNKA